MKYLAQEKFSFHSDAVAKDTFGVVRFTGTEGLSQIYHFDITLVSDDPDIDLANILKQRAAFSIYRPDGSEVIFNGIISQCDIIQQIGDFFLYRVELVPAVWRLTLTHHNQIFLDKNAEEIITAVLKDGGLNNLDFEFRLKGSYVTFDYCCQYSESHYDFISRWMERNGIYYFFEQGEHSEKIIFTDNVMTHVQSEFGKDVIYAPVSGLETLHLEEAMQTCICRRQNVPNKVELKDYNYRKPSLDVRGQSEVSADGVGIMYYYGDHFRTSEEGDKIAKIRSEELLCRAEQYHCESTVPYINPGFQFQLNKHFRKAMNRGYLTIQAEHHGNQTSYLLAGLREQLTTGEAESLYYNSFTAIPDDVQFRQPRTTERPRLNGTITARIDGAGTGKYAELDESGRYKVILPFDQSGRKNGKASTWLRMMQPYAGDGHGMHFPLHKGTEVLLTFIDGNPDRPIIAGAVPNTETASMVTAENTTKAGFKSSGGSSFYTEDSESHERFVMKAGDGSSTLKLGSGSESTFGLVSNSVNVGTEGVASLLSMFGHHDFAIKSNLVMTGNWIIPLLQTVQKLVLEKAPGLAEKITKQTVEGVGEKEGKDKHKIKEESEEAGELAEGVAEIVVGCAELLLEIIWMIIIAKYEKKLLTNAGTVMTSLPHHPAFGVISKGKSTIVLNNASGHDIFLGTDNGKIISSSSTDTEIAAGGDVKISGDNCEMNSARGNIDIKATEIKLEQNMLMGGLFDEPTYIKVAHDIEMKTMGDVSIEAESKVESLVESNKITIKLNGIAINAPESEITMKSGTSEVEIKPTKLRIASTDFMVSVADSRLSCKPDGCGIKGPLVRLDAEAVKIQGKALDMTGNVIKIG